MTCASHASSEPLAAAFARCPLPPGDSWSWPFVTRTPELQLPAQQPREIIPSHRLMELTALLAGTAMRTSGRDALWLLFYGDTSPRCAWPALAAVPLTPAAPAGCCPELTPPRLPSGSSQMFPPGLPSHSRCCHLFGYRPPVVQAVSSQLAGVPDCHMVFRPRSFQSFTLSWPGSSCEACFSAGLQAGSSISTLLYWLPPLPGH